MKLGLVFIAWLCAALLGCFRPPADLTGQLVVIESATLIEINSSGAPQQVTLPLRRNLATRGLRGMRLTAEFQLPATPASDGLRNALITGNLQDGGRILLNGVELDDISTNSAAFTVRHTRPYIFNIPQGALKVGRNTLVREWMVRENVLTSPLMTVGARDTVAEIFERNYFWQNSMAKVSVVLAGSIALILLGLYWQNRSAQHYLCVGGSALGYCIFNFAYFLPPIPHWLFAPWHVLLYGGTGAFAVGAWHYLLHDVNAGNVWYTRFSMAWWLLFRPAYWVHYSLTGLTLWPEFTPLWHFVLASLGVYPAARLAVATWRMRRPRHLVYLVISWLAMAVGFLDAALISGKQFESVPGYALQAVAPSWFICVCFILISDFSKSLRMQREQQAQLAQQLNDQRVELERLYEQTRIVQEKQAAAQERARIMQDMHDGLGSQLVSSLAMAQSGELSASQASDLLRSCIDDLRLAIDCSGEAGEALALALGNLRFRMEPRMRAAGITLLWDTTRMDDRCAVPPHMQLPVLRVIQECITNVLKHAQAKTLSVTLAHTANRLQVEVRDDGRGFEVASTLHHPGDKGLNGLQKRARALEANLEIESSASGTRVRLDLPLPVANS